MKQLLIAFVLLITTSSITAQNEWPKEGAQWEICHGQFWEGDNYSITPSIRYEKDTVINSIQYQKISRHYNEQIMMEFFTRFYEDTIFRYVNGNEYMFFTYNVTIGDTLFPLRTGVADYNEDTCSYTLELLCLDISPITVNGNLLNLYEFVDVGNSIYGTNGQNPGGVSNFYWIEIIGWVSSFPWLIVPSEGTCNDIEFDGGIEFPIHYSDSTRSWSIEFQADGLICDTLLRVEQEPVEHISIYPNPVQKGQLLFIDGLTSNNSIEIINAVGKIQQFDIINSNQIDITHLSDGLYFIKLFDNSNQLHKTVKLLIL